MKISTKFLIICGFFLILIFLFKTSPAELKAATIAELQAQIQAITLQISALQQQLAQIQKEPFSITFPSVSGLTLYQGSTYNITWTGYDADVNQYSVYISEGPLGTGGFKYIGTAYSLQKAFAWTIGTDITLGRYYRLHFSGKGATGGYGSQFNITSRTINNNYWCGNTDINQDGTVNEADRTIFNNNYFYSNYNAGSACSVANSWCNGADIDRNGVLEAVDKNIFDIYFGTSTCREYGLASLESQLANIVKIISNLMNSLR